MTSPDGTRSPPADSIIDAAGEVWTLGTSGPGGRAILKDGAQWFDGSGDLIEWLGAKVVVRNNRGQWYEVMPDAPGYATLAGDPNPPPLPTPPPDQTNLYIYPPAPPPTITDPNGVVWSIDSSLWVCRDGRRTNGQALALQWFGGSIYVKSPKPPFNWWQWTGYNGPIYTSTTNGWKNLGNTTDPSGNSPPVVTFVARVWDGSAWVSGIV